MTSPSPVFDRMPYAERNTFARGKERPGLLASSGGLRSDQADPVHWWTRTRPDLGTQSHRGLSVPSTASFVTESL